MRVGDVQPRSDPRPGTATGTARGSPSDGSAAGASGAQAFADRGAAGPAVTPAAFWGEDTGLSAAGAELVFSRGTTPQRPAAWSRDVAGAEQAAGSALAHLGEPDWWDGSVPLLLILREVYTTVSHRSAEALRAESSPAGASARPAAAGAAVGVGASRAPVGEPGMCLPAPARFYAQDPAAATQHPSGEDARPGEAAPFSVVAPVVVAGMACGACPDTAAGVKESVPDPGAGRAGAAVAGADHPPAGSAPAAGAAQAGPVAAPQPAAVPRPAAAGLWEAGRPRALVLPGLEDALQQVGRRRRR